MKIILYCSLEAVESLSRVIKTTGHVLVDTLTDPMNLVYTIAQRTPHVLVAEISKVVADPHAMAGVLHWFPSLPTLNANPEAEGWEDHLREFLARPRPPEKPRPYATSSRIVFHDGELQKLASGKLRRPDFTAPGWQKECTRQEASFLLQLRTGMANHAAAQRYYHCLRAQQDGLDLELGYRLAHGSWKALSWSRDLAARWLGLLCHYVHGVELDYLPAPLTPGPAVDFVHHSPPVEALHAMLRVVHYGVEIPIAESIKSLVEAKFDKQSETELFQLSIRLYGFAMFLQRMGEAQIYVMDRWLDPKWAPKPEDREYRRYAATYRDFWRLQYIVVSPDPLRSILAGFHAGTTYVLPPEMPSTLPDKSGD